MPNPRTIKSLTAFKFSDNEILQRVAQILDDDTMAWKVDIVGGLTLNGDIDIGAVNILNASDVQINPATEETLAALAASFGAEDFATEATLSAFKTSFDTRDLATSAQQVLQTAILVSLDGKDFATQATLLAFKTAFDSRDLATETTLSAFKTAFDTRDLATHAEQVLQTTRLASLDGKDFATQATLATRLSEADFDARVGEVSATPTANTVLARLKDIYDRLLAILGDAVASPAVNTIGARLKSLVDGLLGKLFWVRLALGNDVSYMASTNGTITGATAAAAVTSIGYLFHPSADAKRIEIDRITISFGVTGNGGIADLRLAHITAENGAPGGTSQTTHPVDPGDGASACVFRSGATGAPTRTAGDLASWLANCTRFDGTSQSTLDIFDAKISGKPLVCRASTAEGYEVRAVVATALANPPRYTVTYYWREI